MPHNPFGERTDFLLQKFEGWIRPHVQEIPAAQFYFSKLRMLVRVPVHIPSALENFIVPLEQFEIIINGMFAIQIDEFKLFDARLFHRTPKFNRPRKKTQVIIGPVIEAACDDLLRVIFEIVKNRNVRITRELRSLLTDLLIRPQILSWEIIIGTIIIWTQQDPANCMERNRAGDIRML